MRLVDVEQCPCNDCVPPLGDSRGCSIFPCREFGEWYKTTAYDVNSVVEELESLNPVDYGSPFSYEGHNCARELKVDAIDIVKRGGVDD